MRKRPIIHIHDPDFVHSADYKQLNQLGGPAEIALHEGLTLILRNAHKQKYQLISNPGDGVILNISLEHGETVYCISKSGTVHIERNITFLSSDHKPIYIRGLVVEYDTFNPTQHSTENEFHDISESEAIRLCQFQKWEEVMNQLLTTHVERYLKTFLCAELENQNWDTIRISENESIVKNSRPKERAHQSSHHLYAFNNDSGRIRQFNHFLRNRLHRLHILSYKTAANIPTDPQKTQGRDPLFPLYEGIQNAVNPLIKPTKIKVKSIQFGEIAGH